MRHICEKGLRRSLPQVWMRKVSVRYSLSAKVHGIMARFTIQPRETLISLLGFAFRALCGLPLREYLVQMQAHAVFFQRLLQKAYV